MWLPSVIRTTRPYVKRWGYRSRTCLRRSSTFTVRSVWTIPRQPIPPESERTFSKTLVRSNEQISVVRLLI